MWRQRTRSKNGNSMSMPPTKPTVSARYSSHRNGTLWMERRSPITQPPRPQLPPRNHAVASQLLLAQPSQALQSRRRARHITLQPWLFLPLQQRQTLVHRRWLRTSKEACSRWRLWLVHFLFWCKVGIALAYIPVRVYVSRLMSQSWRMEMNPVFSLICQWCLMIISPCSIMFIFFKTWTGLRIKFLISVMHFGGHTLLWTGRAVAVGHEINSTFRAYPPRLNVFRRPLASPRLIYSLVQRHIENWWRENSFSDQRPFCSAIVSYDNGI